MPAVTDISNRINDLKMVMVGCCFCGWEVCGKINSLFLICQEVFCCILLHRICNIHKINQLIEGIGRSPSEDNFDVSRLLRDRSDEDFTFMTISIILPGSPSDNNRNSFRSSVDIFAPLHLVMKLSYSAFRKGSIIPGSDPSQKILRSC